MNARDIGHVLASASAAGWEVAVIAGRVRVRPRSAAGPAVAMKRGDDRWREQLRAVDADALAAVLAVDVARARVAMTDVQSEVWSERAAILEFDGEVAKDVAERVAWCWGGSEP